MHRSKSSSRGHSSSWLRSNHQLPIRNVRAHPLIRVDHFELAKHEGPYASWGGKSDLLLGGRKTGLRLDGYQLLHQIECSAGYLFVTDYDCPFEEMTWFTLVSPTFKRLSYRWFEAPYASCILTDLVLLKDGGINFVLDGGGPHNLAIRRWGIPFLFPRISIKRIDPMLFLDHLERSDRPFKSNPEGNSHAP